MTLLPISTWTSRRHSKRNRKPAAYNKSQRRKELIPLTFSESVWKSNQKAKSENQKKSQCLDKTDRDSFEQQQYEIQALLQKNARKHARRILTLH